MTPKRSAERGSARALLEAGRGHSPVRYDVELGRARHRQWVQSDAPLPSWAEGLVGSKMPSVWAGLVIKTLLTLAGLGVVIGALRWSTAHSPARVVERSRTATPPPSAAVVDIEPPPPAAAPATPASDVVSAPVVHKRPSGPRQRSTTRVRAPATPTLVTEAVEPAAPVSVATSAPAPARATPPHNQPKPKPPTPIVVQETRDLAAAEQALTRDPGHALALVTRDERRYPDGYLQQERACVRIMALVQLGRSAQARAEMARFSARYPNTPYAARIRQALRQLAAQEP